jgi:hypothetical protein
MRRWVAAIALVLPLACVSIPDLVDAGADAVGGDVKGDADAAPGDAPSDTTVEAAGDAHSEATGADAPGDAPAVDFCASLDVKPVFCADFDQGANVDTGWTSKTTTGGGTVDFDTMTSVSPKRSALASTPGVATGTLTQASLTYDVTGTPVTLHLELQLQPMSLSSTQFADVVDISRQLTADSAVRLRVYMKTGQSTVQEESTGTDADVYQDYYGVPPPDLGHWHRFDFDLTLSSPPSLSVMEDGLVVLQQSLTYGWTPGPLAVSIGMVDDNFATDSIAVVYDNVLIDTP